ncbi:MAG: tRNA (uridine(54)-C5)-methyltransferase TrmA [Pseudomonadota bacterium]
MSHLLPWEVDPSRIAEIFATKVELVTDSLQVFNPPEAKCFPSPSESYRARAEFRVWHDGDDLQYVMFDPADRRTPVPLRDFPPAIASIRKLMEPLREALETNPTLRKKLFQVEFMGGASDDLLVTLIYHRPLTKEWEAEARALAASLGINVIGRSRKQKIVLDREFVTDHFVVDKCDYAYRQYEQSFVQPNRFVNEHMLNWAWQQAASPAGNLLELYCGNGNFTLPLAGRHDAVIATELSKSGTRAALENADLNSVANVNIIRLSAEEVSQAMAGEREFRRLKVLEKPLAEYDLRSIFVDPPRAGLDAAALNCVKNFERVYYISCNPETLRDNLATLSETHRISALAFFDQFPYTHHLESGVVLERR